MAGVLIRRVVDGIVYGEVKYSADQPRVPAGGPGGGEFGSGGAGGMVMSNEEARRRGLPIVKPEKPRFRVAFHDVAKDGRLAYSAAIHVNGVHVGKVERERGNPAFKAVAHNGVVMSRARELSEVREDIQSSFEDGEVALPGTH